MPQPAHSDPPPPPPPGSERARHAATATTFRKAIVASLFLFGWGLLLSLYAWLGEPGWIEVTHHAVGTPSAAARPLRVVQLADLHLRQLGGRERRVAAAVREARPDLLLLGGDLVDRHDALPVLDAFLSLLDPAVPALAVSGNWEHWAGIEREELRAVLAHRGAALLVNEVARRSFDGRTYAVVGIDDALTGRPDPALAASAAGIENVLVLAHAPVVRDRWEGPPATFMLAAHTHGGQVAFLGYAPALPPGSGRYVSGWYRGPPFDAYVSRGVGTSVLPVRFGARPEVVVVDWWLR